MTNPELEAAIERVSTFPEQIATLQAEVEQLRTERVAWLGKGPALEIERLREQVAYWQRNAEPSGELVNAVVEAAREVASPNTQSRMSALFALSEALAALDRSALASDKAPS